MAMCDDVVMYLLCRCKATLNAEMFSRYFSGAPILPIEGFTFPVEEFYLEHILELTGTLFSLSAVC